MSRFRPYYKTPLVMNKCDKLKKVHNKIGLLYILDAKCEGKIC